MKKYPKPINVITMISYMLLGFSCVFFREPTFLLIVPRNINFCVFEWGVQWLIYQMHRISLACYTLIHLEYSRFPISFNCPIVFRHLGIIVDRGLALQSKYKNSCGQRAFGLSYCAAECSSHIVIRRSGMARSSMRRASCTVSTLFLKALDVLFVTITSYAWRAALISSRLRYPFAFM